MKTLFKINGKYYDRFEDIPEDIRTELDKNGNGQIDLIENHPELKNGETISNIEFEKSYEIKNPNQHNPYIQNNNTLIKVIVIAIICIAASVIYLFIKTT